MCPNYSLTEMEHKEKVKRTAWYLVGVIVYYAWFQTFYNMVAFDDIFPYEDFSMLLEGFGYNFLPIFSLFVLNTLIVFKLTAQVKPEWLKATIDVGLSILATAVVNMAFLGVQSWLFHRQGKVDWAGTLINDFLMLLINEVVFFILHYRESMLREEKQRHLATRLQFDMLKVQINPHFLFNSLNILYSLTSIDTAKSQEFIMSLSQVYRYLLSQQQMQKVKVKDELKFLESYINVLSIRYHDSFFVDFEGKERAGEHEVVPYCMQLLIENITKHNAIRAEHPMRVSIKMDADKIVVSNPVYPKINAPVESSTGMGLRYITELCRYHGRQFRAENREGTFVAELPYL
ncbi:MAG: histidine kinase [Bacteroidales bacterium]|nr:histidine kinase [Bacteroidales bacterium]